MRSYSQHRLAEGRSGQQDWTASSKVHLPFQRTSISPSKELPAHSQTTEMQPVCHDGPFQVDSSSRTVSGPGRRSRGRRVRKPRRVRVTRPPASALPPAVPASSTALAASPRFWDSRWGHMIKYGTPAVAAVASVGAAAGGASGWWIARSAQTTADKTPPAPPPPQQGGNGARPGAPTGES